MTVPEAIGNGLFAAFSMFWQTLWALVLGFGLSGAVQAFVSRPQMQDALGDHRPSTLGKASFFGIVSSSCSYAAAALTKSLFSRGADFTAALVFMIASTNLVVELGLVLWLLIGWQFALAEFVGGAIMIILLGLIVPHAFPRAWIRDAQERLANQEASRARLANRDGIRSESISQRMRSFRGWADAASYTVSDLTMLRRELLIGFLVAGFLAALVPPVVWQGVFLTGQGFLSSLENVVVAPFVAIISFVCSVGNVALAAALWHGGISFGGVIAFVFADLITLPLLSIYRKYYGTRLTLRLLAVFWATMSAAGLAVEYLFRLIGISEPPRLADITHGGVSWNYTSILNIVALVVFAVLYWLYRARDARGPRFAKDPVCGMQVETLQAPATRQMGTTIIYFCSDRCAHRFDQDRSRYRSRHDGPEKKQDAVTGTDVEEAPPTGAEEVDPVCGMTVAPATTEYTINLNGGNRYFCSAACRSAFLANPARFTDRKPAERNNRQEHQ